MSVIPARSVDSSAPPQVIQREVPPRAAWTLEQAGVSPLLARLFAARGVRSAEELDDNLVHLLPPDGLKGIDVAARLLADAITAGEHICVVADYDCDGATACALSLRGLALLGADPATLHYVVPDRAVHGYGLTPTIVDLAMVLRPQLLMTVDNGIASLDGVRHAKALGLKVLVTDHHLPAILDGRPQTPEADAVLNPNQPGCGFQSKNLAGVGVAFYLLLALRSELRARGRYGEQAQPRLDGLLDLVALGTVADVVRLDPNNRILVAQGLKRMRAGRMHAGVAALFRVAGRQARSANPFDLGFALGPRLNAAGRLEDMSLGIECLITDDESRAWELAQQLNDINLKRREIEAEMQDAALLHLDAFEPANSSTICVFDDSWHQGVIGIVASRLKEKFYRPTITFAPAGDGWIKGSGRSIPGFHLRDALDLVYKKAPSLIDKFGGHAMAAGLTLRAEAFEAFSRAFEEVGRAWLSEQQLERVIETDGPLEDAYYTTDFISELDGQVWGQGFAPPVFCDEFRVVSQRVLKERHLKLLLEKNGARYDAIWFGHADALSERARVAFRLDANEYNGVTKVQLLVEHAEPA